MAFNSCSCDCIPAVPGEEYFQNASLNILCGILAALTNPSADTNVNVAEWGGVATSLGQKAMAASVPVTIASDQTWTGATNLGKNEDAVAVSGDTGVMTLAVIQATPASSAADGDYGTFKTDALGKLWGASDQVEDTGHTTGDRGSFILAVRNDASVALTTTDLDYSPIAVDSAGRVQLAAGTVTLGSIVSITTSVTPGTAAANLGKAEDAAHTSGDTGVYSLAVIQATPAASAADGDYGSFKTDALGKLWTAGNQTEDLAAASGDIGVGVLFKRTDTAATQTDTTGDYTTPVANLNGSPIVCLDRTFQASEVTGLLKLRDDPYSGTESGVCVFGQRNDALSQLVGTDGDRCPISVNNRGQIHTVLTNGGSGGALQGEDVVASDGTSLFGAGYVIQATPTANAADGDWTWAKTNALSVLFSEPANQVATWAAATIAGAAGGITTGGANALTNSAKVKRVQLLNTTDQIVQLSLDAGTTWVMSAVATTGIAEFDLGANGRWTASNIHIRSIGSNTSSGSAYISVMI